MALPHERGVLSPVPDGLKFGEVPEGVYAVWKSNLRLHPTRDPHGATAGRDLWSTTTPCSRTPQPWRPPGDCRRARAAGISLVDGGRGGLGASIAARVL